MEAVKSLANDHPYLTGGVVALATVYIVYTLFRRKTLGIIDAPPNTVVLYQFTRGPGAPSMSPFPLKLETYLRVAGIPYLNDFKGKLSSKGKTPWISYNGEPVSDSQICIEYLNKKLNVDLNKDLTVQEKVVAHSLRVMVDEHLYWCIAYFRWIYDPHQTVVSLYFPWIIRVVVGRVFVKRALHYQGTGRHTLEEIKDMMVQDLQVLADQLGDKPFLMGDNPTELDCATFGMLCQLVYHSSDDIAGGLVQERFPTLFQFCERMKAKVWPDWEDCITKGNTTKALK